MARTANDAAGGATTVVFRYDDCSAASPLDLERWLFDAFLRSGLPLTVGVTPAVVAGDVHDPDARGNVLLGPPKLELLRRAAGDGTVEVALHGWSDQTVRRPGPGGGSHSEFRGVGYAAQQRKVEEGRRHLERALSVPVTTFSRPRSGEWPVGTVARGTDIFVAHVGEIAAGVDHHGMMPSTLAKTLVKTFSPAGGLVGDCCCGSDTTLLTARDTGRDWWGYDVVPRYVDLARRRLAAGCGH